MNWAALGLFLITRTHLLAHLKQRQSHGITAHKQVAHMCGKTGYEVASVETLLQHIIQEKEAIRNLSFEEIIHQFEVVFLAQDIQVLADILVRQVSARETYHLVEDGKGISHAAISLLCYEGKCFWFCLITLFLSHIHQVVDSILRGHPLEVIHLTSTQDCGKNLMLFGRAEDEDNVGRRLLQGLKESIKGRWGKHVHLVDDEHLVLARLRRDEDLFAEFSDVVHRVVAGSIKLVDVHGALLVEGLAAFALSTRFPTLLRVEAIDGFCKDACTSGFTHATRSTEEIGMSQLSTTDGILQRGSQRPLTYDRVKVKRTIFECRNNVFFHLLNIFLQI